MKAIVLLMLLFAWPGVKSGLTQHELASVGAAPPANARAPLSLAFVDAAGARRTLGQAMAGRPTVLVFADYTCRYLCGPGLVLTAAALDATRLAPGRDYSFVVIGINPRDGPAQARAMRAARLRPGAGAAAQLLSGGAGAVLAAALGYHYLYDAQLGQYAHDTAVYILAPDGRVSRILPQFALTGAGIAGALEHAATRPAGLLTTPLRIICYCLQPLTGAFDAPAVFALRTACLGFLVAAGAAFLMLRRARERRR
ncbi:MAG TPA: hypothetical protein VMU93_07230 [Caulobacteraceae bacterium]|nr:hypothetical protein [Caulobacteraceae bacterium]